MRDLDKLLVTEMTAEELAGLKELWLHYKMEEIATTMIPGDIEAEWKYWLSVSAKVRDGWIIRRRKLN